MLPAEFVQRVAAGWKPLCHHSVTKKFALEMIPARAPLDEILPENHPAKNWKAGKMKPFARGRIRDSRKHGKFLGVQRLIQPALFQHILQRRQRRSFWWGTVTTAKTSLKCSPTISWRILRRLQIREFGWSKSSPMAISSWKCSTMLPIKGVGPGLLSYREFPRPP